jgi:hypothetical protein
MIKYLVTSALVFAALSAQAEGIVFTGDEVLPEEEITEEFPGINNPIVDTNPSQLEPIQTMPLQPYAQPIQEQGVFMQDPGANQFGAQEESIGQNGTISNLVAYESRLTGPSDSETNIIINVGQEMVTPSSFSFYGGLSLVMRDSFDLSLNAGARAYSQGAIIMFDGAPVYAYAGAGLMLLGETSLYPEIGVRMLPSDNTRLDIYLRAYTGSGDTYGDHVTFGLALSF